jgi:hypothetical protein
MQEPICCFSIKKRNVRSAAMVGYEYGTDYVNQRIRLARSMSLPGLSCSHSLALFYHLFV